MENLAEQEREVQALSAEINDLRKRIEAETVPPSARLAQLRSQNQKLKYQKMHLERSIEAQKALPPLDSSNESKLNKKERKADKKNKAAMLAADEVLPTEPETNVSRTSPERMDPDTSAGNMVALKDHVTDLFTAAIASAFPGEPDLPVLVVPVTNPKLPGDFQCNSAMAIAKSLKGKPNAPVSPRDAALRIQAHLPSSVAIGSVNVQGAGFVNVVLNPVFLAEQVENVVADGVRPPRVEKKRILVDFSSPNIAKEMHVGHLRSTIIGDCISRLLEYLGHEVLRINHVGDWGTQFGMLIAHLKDEFPNFERESPPISDLQAFYKASKKRFDEDEEFKKRAHAEVVQLQQGEPGVTKAWNLICDVSRKEFQVIYDKLDIVLKEVGESFYQSMMKDMVKMLDDKGLLVEDEGRKVMFVPGHSVPLIIEKSNGGYTYDTSDMAAINYRLNVLNVDWALYVVDMGQGLHFDTLFPAAQLAGIYDPAKKRVEHVGFGVVLGEDRKKFKTRSGDTVRLIDLIDEALVRAKAIIEQKQSQLDPSERLAPEEVEAAYTAVAYGAVKYNDLKGSRQADYVFSFDRMLDLKGNTAAYLLYAYTRISSIARKAKVDNVAALPDKIVLEHPKEIALATHILRFPEVIKKITQELCPHVLCEYLFELSTCFTDFYEACRVIDMPNKQIASVNYSRLKLCDATAKVIAKGFDILGLKYVQRM